MRIDRADFWQTRFYILHQFCIFSIVRPRKPSRQSMQSLPKYIATTLRWSFSSECPMCHIVIWSVPDFLTYLFDYKNLWRCLLLHLVNWTSWWRTMKRWQSHIFFPPHLTFGVFRWNYCVLSSGPGSSKCHGSRKWHHMPSSLYPAQKLIDLASNGFNRTSNLCESQVYTSQGIQTPAYNCQSLPATEKLLKCLLNHIFPIVYYSIRNRF